MPTKSKSQQRFMGLVRLTQKGELPRGLRNRKRIQQTANQMSEEDVMEYAGTKHKGLPERKMKRGRTRR